DQAIRSYPVPPRVEMARLGAGEQPGSNGVRPYGLVPDSKQWNSLGGVEDSARDGRAAVGINATGIASKRTFLRSAPPAGQFRAFSTVENRVENLQCHRLSSLRRSRLSDQLTAGQRRDRWKRNRMPLWRSGCLVYEW